MQLRCEVSFSTTPFLVHAGRAQMRPRRRTFNSFAGTPWKRGKRRLLSTAGNAHPKSTATGKGSRIHHPETQRDPHPSTIPPGHYDVKTFVRYSMMGTRRAIASAIATAAIVGGGLWYVYGPEVKERYYPSFLQYDIVLNEYLCW